MGTLSQGKIAGLSTPGFYPDGDGLYLQVAGSDSKSWVFRYSFRGKARYLGLGSARDITLAKARAARDKARVQIREGVDPVAARREQREKLNAVELEAKRKEVTFREAAEACIENKKSGWSNVKHAAQWSSTLDRFAHPRLGNLPVGQVDRAGVIGVLAPIWLEKKETANRLRGRIEDVLAFAMSKGWRSEGNNPAERSKLLLNGLPQRPQGQQKHFPSLPYAQISEFMPALRQCEGLAARALEFLILTAARPGEAIGARWEEFDFKRNTWTIPAERMKRRIEHCVPLSAQAIAVTEAIPRIGDLVFPNPSGAQYSDAALRATLQRMGFGHVTAHGFRATFRSWADDRTNFEHQVKEHALAHGLKDKTEAAYSRSDRFQKRARLMQAWADFCDGPAEVDNVVSMRSAS